MTSPLSLFKNILGVKDAVITKIDGGDDTSDCHVYLRPRLHTLGKCPTCGKKCSGYDDGSGSGESTWRALDLSGKKSFFIARLNESNALNMVFKRLPFPGPFLALGLPRTLNS